MSADPFYITTPIYYVNDKPHLGHAYTTLLADVLARYHRLSGRPTWFLTGTDEHGQKVQQAADAAGVSPQEHVDKTVVPFQELWKKLEITHDDFIRTTEKRHTSIVQRILQDLYDQGEIYRDEYSGWYCVPDERFFSEDELVDGNCPECGRSVEKITEANYFFRMGRHQEWLIQYIEDHPTFIQPDFRRNETLGFLKKPLKDLCISRPKSRLAWGIELPFDSEFVTYVWFDALVNYISAVGYGADEKRFGQWWPASCHLIGKDILTTHTVYWPTMLKAAGIEQPQMIFAHGWWLVGDSKMSKSVGNVVNPMDLIDKHGVDPFRYFMMAAMVLGQDANFTGNGFATRYNADLANDLGNLASRVINMMVKNCEGTIPNPGGDALAGEAEQDLWGAVEAAVEHLPEAVDRMTLDRAIAQVLAVVRATNRYLEVRQPWKQAKAEDKQPLCITLYVAGEVLRAVSGLLYPVMPGKMTELRVALGVGDAEPELSTLKEFGGLQAGTSIKPPKPLFPRIVMKEEPTEEVPAAKVVKQPETAASSEDGVGLITYEDFSKVQLRTAKIMDAEKVPETTKLLRLEIMMGNERRQLVAGIALHYEPDDLIGKTVVVVANLKPTKIRGVESQGMLLAASKGESLRLVTVEGELSSGASVK